MRSAGMILVSLSLTACFAPSDPLPAFRSAPPVGATTLSQAPVASGSLEGRVYSAQSTTLDSSTRLPAGYGPLPDGNGMVTAIHIATRRTWRATITKGSYLLEGLPLGIPLEVTASSYGFGPRVQTVSVGPLGRGRLHFAYADGQDDHYLVPLPVLKLSN